MGDSRGEREVVVGGCKVDECRWRSLFTGRVLMTSAL